MADPARKDDRRYTYRDYASWPDDERWELIDGVAWSMSPAPGTNHQRVSRVLLLSIGNWLSAHPGPCEVLDAPLDVFLPREAAQADEDVDTVVQPDLVVVCDPTRLTARGCRGAPDLVVEILSPWTSHKDQVQKLDLYARHEVREFWVVDPGNRYVRVYRRRASSGTVGFGDPAMYIEPAILDSVVLPGYTIPVADLFVPLGAAG